MPAHARAAVATASDEDRWPRIRALLAEVAGAATLDRARRFADAWADDTVLRAEVADFLATSGQDDELLYEFPTEWLCAAATVDATTAIEPRRFSARAWQPGSVVGPYVVEQLVGEGGMGQVFAAYDERLGRAVALKRVLPARADRPDASRRTLIEASAVARLDHPNIATVYDVLEHDGRVVIVMQYVEGQSMKRHLARGPFDVLRALRIAHALAGAADYAHQHGIVHCDIKPGNVHLTAGDLPKLLDFGIARLLGGGRPHLPGAPLASAVGGRFGTPGYMAPEQLTGRAVDPRTDVYALGVVLYEMLSGERPFGRSNPMVASLMMLEGEAPDLCVLNPAVPWPVRALVAKAMAKDPRSRFQSAAALQQEIVAVMEATGLTRRRLSRPAAHVVRGSYAALSAVVLPLLLWLSPKANTVPLRPIVPAARTAHDAGVAALQSGAYHDAAEALELAVRLDPGYPLAWARLAQARKELDDGELAHEALVKLGKLVPDRSHLPDAIRLSLDAIDGMVTRDHPAALQAYAGLLKSQERPPAPLLLDIGRAYEASESIPEAIEYYEKAITADPAYAPAHLRAGVLYGRRLENKDPEKALAAFAKAEDLYQRAGRVEGQALVNFERGVLYNRFSQPKMAQPALARALELATSINHQYLRTATLFKLSSVARMLGAYDDAERLAREATEIGQIGQGLDALTANGMVDFGNVFVARGDRQAAAKLFERALKLAQSARAPQAEARARLALGSVEIDDSRASQGISKVRASLAFYEQGRYRRMQTLAQTILARGLEVTGALKEAETEYGKLLARAREEGDRAQAAEQLYLLAGVLMSGERYASALQHVEEAIGLYDDLGLEHDLPSSRCLAAELLWRLGRTDAARRELAKVRGEKSGAGALTEVGRLASIQRARILLSTDRPRDAIGAVQRIATESSSGPWATRAAAQATLALALARSGRAPDAVPHVAAALAATRERASPVLESDLGLVQAEVLLRAGQHQAALDLSLKLAAVFADRQRFESLWLASLIASRAASIAGNRAAADEHRRAAATAMALLVQGLPSEQAAALEARRDIQRLRREWLR